MLQLLKVGADIEIFLKDQKGKPVPSCGLIGGTKEQPRPIDNEGSALQEDNVMLEFNIIPSATADSFKEHINKVLVCIIEELSINNLVMDITPSKVFPKKALSHPQAKTMGCDPDFSAWTLRQNPLINPKQMKRLRTSGGHVHISFQADGKDPNNLQKVNLIRMLDLALGIPSVLLDDDMDRRTAYGKAGAYRYKASDRVEYRTLSNFWIKNDTLKEWVFNNVRWAFSQLNNGYDFISNNFWGELHRERIEASILTGDPMIALDLIKTFNIPMPS